MAKKKIDANEPPKKSIEEMSDTEFITYADYLASPYYRAYVSARVRAESVAQNNQKGGFIESTESEKNKEIPKNRREKKNVVCLALILVIMILILLLAATYFVNIDAINGFTSLYKIPDGKEITVENAEAGLSETKKADEYIGFFDPVIAIAKQFLPDLGMESTYYTRYVEGKFDEAAPLVKVALCAVPLAIVLVAICALIGLIKAIAAIASGKKEDGYYKKYKFGFLSIIIFLCGIVMGVGGLYFSGIGATAAVEYLTMKSTQLQMGYAIYALIGLSIITFILSCASYKKKKKA